MTTQVMTEEKTDMKHMTEMSLDEKNYDTNGMAVFEGLFDEEAMDEFVLTFYNRMLLQAYKLRLVDEYNPKETVPSPEEIDELAMKVNQCNKLALDFAIQELRESGAAYKVVSSGTFLQTASRLLNCPESLLKIHIDGILVNLPKNETRLYKFHSEQHYYPQRSSFFNLWMPVVRKKELENGAMLVKLKAHKRHYPFVEYTGFNKVENYAVSEEQAYHQLQIPEGHLEDLETVVADLPVNSTLIFDKNVPHTSTVNKSDRPSYAFILRCYDYRFDPTLSDRTGVRPYTTDAAKGGYPNLRPLKKEAQ